MQTRLKERVAVLAASIVRYPVTALCLIIAAVISSVAAETSARLSPWILTFAAAAIACALGQAVNERLSEDGDQRGWSARRALLQLGGLVVAALFYLSIKDAGDYGAELFTRSVVTLFALVIAFIWSGVIRSRYGFDESFMAAFKAVFQAGLFSGVLFLGCAAVIAAVDQLITPVSGQAYTHTANVIFIIIAPLILLSLIPVYPGRAALRADGLEDDPCAVLIAKRVGCPKFLEVLLSYIVIPLTAVFTVILLVYIILNIGGKFWTDNLLEPLLIAYSVVVIAVVLLTGRLENKFAILFRRIFPKVLIPIALFQIVASALSLGDTGLTYGRYYVLLYGVFAVLAGLVLGFLPIRKSGLVALLLVILSTVSLVPPVDAFTVSRNSQIAGLEATLTRNGMLTDNDVTPKAAISDKDKTKIAAAIRYLTETDNLRRLSWLPSDFSGYDDDEFYRVFGFHLYQPASPEYRYISVYYDQANLVPVTGYDYLTRLTLPTDGKSSRREFVIKNKSYTLSTGTLDDQLITIQDHNGRELLRFDVADIYKRYEAYGSDKNLLSSDEATFTIDSPEISLKIVVMNANMTKSATVSESNMDQSNTDLLVLIKVK